MDDYNEVYRDVEKNIRRKYDKAFEKWIKSYKRTARFARAICDTYLVNQSDVANHKGKVNLSIVLMRGCCGKYELIERERFTKGTPEHIGAFKTLKRMAREKTADKLLDYFSMESPLHLGIIEAIKKGPFSLDDLTDVEGTASFKNVFLDKLVRKQILERVPQPKGVDSRRQKFWDLILDLKVLNDIEDTL